MFKKVTLHHIFFVVIIFASYSFPFISNADTEIFRDDFASTTIDTNKWTEVDPGGQGGTVGNITQNGSLSIKGDGTWYSVSGTNVNYLLNKSTYDRNAGNLVFDADVTCGSNSHNIAIGYGDPTYGPTNPAYGPPHLFSGYSYRIQISGNTISFYRYDKHLYDSGIIEGGPTSNRYVCTNANGNLVHIKMVINSDSGASLYLNRSETPYFTLTGGTFNNEGFFIQGGNSISTLIDDVIISRQNNVVIPDAPTGLMATAFNSQVRVSWVAPINTGGGSITDYKIEYKPTSSSSWAVFNHSTSTNTYATVTNLVNGTSYDFRVSAINSVGVGASSNTSIATPINSLLSDDFFGTTIDTNKWTETDNSIGGTVGLVQQNDSLKISSSRKLLSDGVQNGIASVSVFDRTSNDVNISFSLKQVGTCASAGNSNAYFGFGDKTLNFISNSGEGYYIKYSLNTNTWYLYYVENGHNINTVLTGIPSCVPNVPINFTLVIQKTGGVRIYVNGSQTPIITTNSGTFTNKPFWMAASSGDGVDHPIYFDDVIITGDAPVETAPDAPSSLSTTSGTNQMSLSWTPGYDHGSAITDYVIGYKLSSTSTWSTFSHTPSTTTSVIITGLTASTNYDFKVAGVNAVGTSTYSSEINSSTIANPLPFAPTISTSTASSTKVILLWTSGGDNGSPVTDYKIEYKPSGGDWLTFEDGVSTATSTAVINLTNGIWYSFRVSAVNANGTSSASNEVSSKPFYNGPQAPVASNLSISGSTIVGEDLAGSYDYLDANGDIQGNSIYRWLWSTTTIGSYIPIANATSSVYTVDQAYVGKYIKFEVTPISVGTASTTGLTATSSYVDQITQDTNPPTPLLLTTSSGGGGGSATATIRWNTIKSASSLVEYGLSSVYLASTTEADTSFNATTSHSLTITNLVPCTTYRYRAYSIDRYSILGTSTDSTLTTTCTGGATVLASTSMSVSRTEVTDLPIELKSDNKGVKLTVPVGSVGTDAEFQIKQLEKTAVTASVIAPVGFTTVGSHMYDMKALSKTSTSSISIFNDPLTITISYDTSDLSGIKESDLQIYSTDGTSWEPLSGCSLNTDAKTITCNTYHFSVFGLFSTPTTPPAVVTTPVVSSSGGGGGGGGGVPAVNNGTTTPGCSIGDKFSKLTGKVCVFSTTVVPGCSIGAKYNTFTGQLCPVGSSFQSTYKFTRDLKFGIKGEDVRQLQLFLNGNGFIIASSGLGSVGKESTYFGTATQKALIKFQKAKNITPSAGYFGAKTRKMLGV